MAGGRQAGRKPLSHTNPRDIYEADEAQADEDRFEHRFEVRERKTATFSNSAHTLLRLHDMINMEICCYILYLSNLNHRKTDRAASFSLETALFKWRTP